MKSFGLDQIKLEDETFARRQNLANEYVRNFDLDRLMHTFRLNAGLDSNAKPLGGWEAPSCQLRGHFVGHFLAAASKFAFGCHDQDCAGIANKIVDILEECAQPNGYLSAFEEEQLDVLEENENTGVWAPYYTLHKILNGLVCCSVYLHNEKAVKLAENLALYIYSRFSKLSYWKIDNILRCTRVNPVNEFGGMGDVLYSLWEITKNPKILELAKLFDRSYFIDNLANENDILEDLHANTHLPLIIAACHRYQITGEEKYKKAVLHFYEYLLCRTFANGNSSSRATHPKKGLVAEFSEHWGGKILSGDDLTGGECESCCAHNTEILLSYLLQIDPHNSLLYLNHMENLKYNAVINSTSNITGLSQYHQPLGKYKTKKFSSMYNDFWCCTASGIEAMSELQKDIWLYDHEERIILNMFVPSTLILHNGDLQLKLTTNFPASDRAEIQILTDKPVKLCLGFKKDQVANVYMNNKPLPLIITSHLAVIQGVFTSKDKITIDIRGDIRYVPLGKSKDIFCIMRGNVLYANILGKFNMNEPLTLNSDGGLSNSHSTFIPLYQVEQEKYTVYLNSKTSKTAKDGSSAYQSQESEK